MGRFFVRCLIVRIWVDQWTNEHIETITTLQHVASFCRVISAKGKSSARGTGREHVRGTQCAARHPCPSMPIHAHPCHVRQQPMLVLRQLEYKAKTRCMCYASVFPLYYLNCLPPCPHSTAGEHPVASGSDVLAPPALCQAPHASVQSPSKQRET